MKTSDKWGYGFMVGMFLVFVVGFVLISHAEQTEKAWADEICDAGTAYSYSCDRREIVCTTRDRRILRIQRVTGCRGRKVQEPKDIIVYSQHPDEPDLVFPCEP